MTWINAKRIKKINKSMPSHKFEDEKGPVQMNWILELFIQRIGMQTLLCHISSSRFFFFVGWSVICCQCARLWMWRICWKLSFCEFHFAITARVVKRKLKMIIIGYFWGIDNVTMLRMIWITLIIFSQIFMSWKVQIT